ncbi:MAG: hypothetical protein R3A48_04660 [Polyangiales bacterium]
MSRALAVTLAALLGCEPEAVVIFPDAGPVPPRDVVASALPDAADVVTTAEDRAAPVDDAPLFDAGDFDLDGGASPACGDRARLEDPAGDYLVVGNPSGGRVVIELDTPVRAVGILTAGLLAAHFTGASLGALQRVLLVGPEAGRAAVSGVSSAVRVERVREAPSPLADAEGVSTMTCAAGCDPLRPPREVGCNSRAQVFAFFTSRLGEGRRWALLQRETLDGLRVRASAGGCCL